MEKIIKVKNVIRHICSEFDNKLVIHIITLWDEFKKLEYVETEIKINSEVQVEDSEEDLVEDEEEAEYEEPQENLLQKAIKLKQ